MDGGQGTGNSHGHSFGHGHMRGSAFSGFSQMSASATPNRAGTPESRAANNPFHEDGISPAARVLPVNPFASPYNSRPASAYSSTSAIRTMPVTRFFHSRRVKKGEIDQPWKSKVDPKEKWVTIIPLIGLALGFAIAGFLVYDGLSTVVHHKYCQVLSDDFSQGLNTAVWTQEAEVGGYG